MNATVVRLVYWAPRVLAVLFALFVSLFALDVFSEGYGFAEKVLALAIHLIPTAVILASLAVAWWRERIGGALFVALGLAVVVSGEFAWPGNLILSVPALLIGALFLVSGAIQGRCRQVPHQGSQ